MGFIFFIHSNVNSFNTSTENLPAHRSSICIAPVYYFLLTGINKTIIKELFKGITCNYIRYSSYHLTIIITTSVCNNKTAQCSEHQNCSISEHSIY